MERKCGRHKVALLHALKALEGVELSVAPVIINLATRWK